MEEDIKSVRGGEVTAEEVSGERWVVCWSGSQSDNSRFNKESQSDAVRMSPSKHVSSHSATCNACPFTNHSYYTALHCAVIPHLDDTSRCHTGLTMGLTTMLNKQPLFVQHGCQTGLNNRFDSQLYTRYSRLSKRFHNWFDNRLYRVDGA